MNKEKKSLGLGKQIENKLSAILEMANSWIGTRAFFIARTGNHQFSFLKVLNQAGCKIEEGAVHPLEVSI
jgi:hypothetical protein